MRSVDLPIRSRSPRRTNTASLPAPLTSRSPERLGGAVVFAGTPVRAHGLIDYCEGGHPLDHSLDEFPCVTRKRGHRATAVRYDRIKGRIVVELSSGVRVAFPVAGTPALRHAGRTQLAQVVTSSSGSVLRWETLDVDLSVAGLLLAIA